MKKLLPVLFFILFALFLSPGVHASDITSAELSQICGTTPLETCKIRDKDVEFAAKVAARSKQVLEWTLQRDHYLWINLQNKPDPFAEIWVGVRNVIYALLGLSVLVAAFLMIITRGKSLTVRKFIPRFIFVVILVALSFSLVKTLYDVTE